MNKKMSDNMNEKMSEKIDICEACIDLNVTATSREEVLKYLVGLLVKHGFVNSAYTNMILEREVNYPTGLRFPKIAIAIPHSDPNYIKKSAIAIGRCKNKPMFGMMEDPTQQIGVDIVVLIAVKNPESHLIVLSKLMEIFTFEENCEKLFSCDSKEEVCQFFKTNLYEK